MGAIEIRGSTGDSSGAGVAAPSGSSGADVGDEGPPDWLGAGVEAPFDAHGAADAVPVAAAAVVVDTPTSHCPWNLKLTREAKHLFPPFQYEG